jgi:hypothetical protein
MEFAWLFVALAITTAVVAFVARPIVKHRGFEVTSADRRLSSLEAERDQILSVIQELDMDFAAGKLSESTYREQRGEWFERGAAILKELDEMGQLQGGGMDWKDWIPTVDADDLEAEIEAAVSRRRKRQSMDPWAYCSQCGNKLQEGDRFCAKCGSKVNVAEVSN